MNVVLEKENAITIPEDIFEANEALFLLYRKIEKCYLDLPWPDQKIREIILFTEVLGGQGDIRAAAKVIAWMQSLSPKLNFDWVLDRRERKAEIPASFLPDNYDCSKINIRFCSDNPNTSLPGDFLIVGPVKLNYGHSYIEKRINRKNSGPLFSFGENAMPILTFQSSIHLKIKNLLKTDNDYLKAYSSIHHLLFPVNSSWYGGRLPMGIQPGTGIFLDQSLIKAPLSRGCCCPSYLLQLQEEDLKKHILTATGIQGQEEPNYELWSINFGYAHHSISREKFIDCVAIHEKKKNVVIVCNQNGVFKNFATEEFKQTVFTPERLAFLKQKGYGTVLLKGQEQEFLLQTGEANERSLVVIIRPFFKPADMRCLQLASERLLGTGDNSAVEAWCARCILYLYEDVGNGGCKWQFLQQQVDVAKTISPSLSELLALFGGDRRTPYLCNEPLTSEQREKMEELLNDQSLGLATLQFCEHLTSHYSFEPVLTAALKRFAWLHCFPELKELEIESLNQDFRRGVIDYFRKIDTEEASDQVVITPDLSELNQRVNEYVSKHLAEQSQ